MDKLKSITGDALQEQLLNELFDSRYFGSQHWFAARAEIVALWERIKELEGQKPSRAKRDEVNKEIENG